MKLQNYFPVFILFSVMVMACNKSFDKQSGNDKMPTAKLNQTAGVQKEDDNVSDWTMLNNLLAPKYELNEEGHVVRLDLAFQCISLFKPAMFEHVIMDTIGIRMGMYRVQPMRITEFEEFGSANLVSWMVNTVKKYDSAGHGKNLGIRLMFGIYTHNFLQTYLPNNPKLIAEKEGRFTIFLVPYYYNPNNVKNNQAQYITDIEATAYELGGLYP